MWILYDVDVNYGLLQVRIIHGKRLVSGSCLVLLHEMWQGIPVNKD